MAGVTLIPNPSASVVQLFGDGSHPTTRLARAALAEALATRRGARVLDVGTGTGLLAREALEAGAGEVIGIDHAPQAIETARTLVRGARFHLADAADYLFQHAGGAFDVVVANLGDPPLVALIPDLAAAARLGGILLVTGLQLWQADDAARALREAGAHPGEPRAEGGWCLISAAC